MRARELLARYEEKVNRYIPPPPAMSPICFNHWFRTLVLLGPDTMCGTLRNDRFAHPILSRGGAQMQQMTVSLTAVPWDLVVAYFCVGVWIGSRLREELATEERAESC